MSLLRPFLTLLCALSLSGALQAAPSPYHETADDNARNVSETGVYDFFKDVLAQTQR